MSQHRPDDEAAYWIAAVVTFLFVGTVVLGALIGDIS